MRSGSLEAILPLFAVRLLGYIYSPLPLSNQKSFSMLVASASIEIVTSPHWWESGGMMT
jgi:hypothetical protein